MSIKLQAPSWCQEVENRCVCVFGGGLIQRGVWCEKCEKPVSLILEHAGLRGFLSFSSRDPQHCFYKYHLTPTLYWLQRSPAQIPDSPPGSATLHLSILRAHVVFPCDFSLVYSSLKEHVQAKNDPSTFSDLLKRVLALFPATLVHFVLPMALGCYLGIPRWTDSTVSIWDSNGF